MIMEDNLLMPLNLVISEIQKRILKQSTYAGINCRKSPLDFWVYQEIIFDIKPDIIIEIGSYEGGSALAFAHLCDAIGKGMIISMDINNYIHPLAKKHPRIKFLIGDACELYPQVFNLCKDAKTILINEDSAHTYSNTLNILNKYSFLVTLGSYFIVEDSNCHHGLNVGPNPGPYEAILEFLNKNKKFISDREKESFLITWNPRGYLKRVS